MIVAFDRCRLFFFVARAAAIVADSAHTHTSVVNGAVFCCVLQSSLKLFTKDPLSLPLKGHLESYMRPTLYTPSGAKVALMPEPEAIGAWTVASPALRTPSVRQNSVNGGGVGDGDENSIASQASTAKTETGFKGRPKRRKWANNFRGGSVTPMDSQG